MWLAEGLLTFSLLHVATAQIGVFDCPTPWKALDDRCYKFEVWADTLQGAKEACSRDGASLVSINSPDENDFITDWLAMNELDNREWYTSGKKNDQDDRFTWEGDGTPVEGAHFWLDEDARKEEGDRILYHTRGQQWGWKVGPSVEANQEKSRPYICEISKVDVFKITEEERDYGYGVLETDPNKYERGTHFIQQPHDVLFDSTSNFDYLTIECVADANPKPFYKWYRRKAGMDVFIDPNLDNRVTITNGRLALNDPDDEVGDNGEYQCRAGNKFGEILSNTVIVSFGYLNDFPKSSRDPVYVSAFQGTGIECNPPAHGYPGLYYQWLKDGRFIYTSRKPYIFISLNGKLYFSSVTKDDEGYYQCLITVPESQYSHNGGKQSQPIDLYVRESLGSERPPQIESGFPAVFPSSPKVGDNVTIECFARGYSSQIDGMQYSWEKVGEVLPDNAVLKDFNRVLYIPNIQLINSGEYKCNVRLQRDSGQDSSSVVVPVEAEPYFTIPLKNQHIDEGSTLTWQCIADGRPQIQYAWYRNGEELTMESLEEEDRNRYTLQNNVLTIRDADPGRDQGMYQCGAANTRATRYSSAQLRILSFAPSFAKHPLQERTYASLRGNVTIICNPEAAPSATKEWYKDNRLMSASTDPMDRVYLLPNGNLRMSGVHESDAGVYRCKASNSLGEAESEGTLTVLPMTVITNPPEQTTVQVNRTAFFHCEASYNPTLDITYDWYHNDYHIEFIKIRIIGDYPHIEREEYFERGTGINRGGLFIRNVQYYHQGIYTCAAKTTTDEVSAPARLIVVGPPFMPVGIEVDSVTASSCRVHWRMGINADNGGTLSAFYIEKKHVDDDEWRRATGAVTSVVPEMMHTTVTGLTPASTYKFRVRAENEYGIGEPSMPSESRTTLDAPPTTAPTWIGRCVNKVGTLCISWTPVPLSERNGEGFGYMLQFKKNYIIDDEWTIINITQADATQYVHTVGQRETFKEYDIQVRSMNRMGFGPASPQVTIRSAMDIPAVQARELRIWQVNATALLAEWDAVDPNTDGDNPAMKGILKGYRINYWRDCCESEEMAIFNQVEGHVDNGMIIGLFPDTYYWLTVQVFNEAGYGPKSDPYLQETLRAAPVEAPQEVKVYVEDSRSVRVRWRGVSTGIYEEPLEGYIIRFWRQSENRYMSHDVDARKKTDYVVKGLEKNTMYEMRVLGYSRGGDGLMSSPIIQFILGKNCRIREDSPDKDYIYKCKGESGSAAPCVSILSLIVITLLHTLLHL